MHTRQTLLTSLIVACFAAPAAQAAEKPDPTPPPRGTTSFVPLPELEKRPLTSATFVVRAAIANMSEIELGELAMQRADDPAVQSFARQLVQQHRAANEKLRRLAIEQKVSMPGTVDEEQSKLQQELAKLQGDQFEQRYIDEMTKAHDKAVALFEAASKAEALPDPLRDYAGSTLATLREHKKTAEGLD